MKGDRKVDEGLLDIKQFFFGDGFPLCRKALASSQGDFAPITAMAHREPTVLHNLFCELLAMFFVCQADIT